MCRVLFDEKMSTTAKLVIFLNPVNILLDVIRTNMRLNKSAKCIYVYLYLYVPDEGSLLPKYRDCTTSNDFELYIYIDICNYVLFAATQQLHLRHAILILSTPYYFSVNITLMLPKHNFITLSLLDSIYN